MSVGAGEVRRDKANMSRMWWIGAHGRDLAIAAAALSAAGVAGALVAAGLWHVALAVAVAVPVVAVVARAPFAGLLIWLLVVPYFLQQVDAHLVIWAFHRLAIPALLVITVIYDAVGIRRSYLRIRLYDLSLALFLAVGLVNILMLSEAPARMLVAFFDQMAIPVMFFWLVRATSPGSRDLRRLATVGAWTIAVQAAVGLLSWWIPNVLPPQWLARAGERTVGTFGGPGPYTLTLVFFGLLALHSVMSEQGTRKRPIMIGAAAIGLVAIVASLSRGSWLGAGLALLGLAIVYPRKVAGVTAAVMLLIVALAIGPLAGEISRAEERLGTAQTVQERTITNAASLRIVADYPLVGVGYGNFDRFDERYKRRVEEVPLIVGGSSHNTYLNLLAEFGIPSTLLYLTPPIVLLLLTLRLHRKNPHSRVVDWSLIGILWLALLDQFVVSNFLEIIHSSLWATSLWWLTLGLIASMLERLRHGSNISASGGDRTAWNVS